MYTYYDPDSVLGTTLSSSEQNRQKISPCRAFTQAIMGVKDKQIHKGAYGMLGVIKAMEKT